MELDEVGWEVLLELDEVRVKVVFGLVVLQLELDEMEQEVVLELELDE